MIFFVIDAATREDFSGVTDLARFTEVHTPAKQNRLVAWNEVYPLSEEPTAADDAMWQAIRTAAEADGVCQQMLATFRDRHGLDPFAATPAWFAGVARETLLLWANPRIGNISANWEAPPRRPVGPTAIDGTWLKCDFLDDATKAAVTQLDARLRQPSRSARDQVRICHHVIDLARAVLGELTSYVAKRAEKHFALELCGSDALEADLIELLRATREPGGIPESFRFGSTEYLRYYLGGRAEALDGSAPGTQARILETIWDETIGRQPTNPPAESVVVREIWQKLPPIIRLSILANDLRKVLLGSTGGRVTVHSTQLRSDTTYGFDDRAETLDLSISTAQRAGTGWRFVEPWAPDERHPATLSARRMLSPIWAGPSGHVAKNLAFYRMFLRREYPSSADRAIPAGLFALWRLYYARRYSPAHTLIETCEGTTHGVTVSRVPRRIGDAGAHDHADAYHLFAEAEVVVPPRRSRWRRRVVDPGGTVLDGAALLEMLRRRYLDGVAGDLAASAGRPLQREIDRERSRLTSAGYVVPRWSHELDAERIGVAASPFRPPSQPTGRPNRARRKQVH